MTRCIPPPAPANENDGIIDRPANDTTNLTEEYARWSDYGNREMWVDLYHRIKKSETHDRRTGAGRKKRRVTG